MIFSSPLTSCNTDEKKFTEFNTRIEKISLLSDSYKSSSNDYLKTLIDSIKIIKNEYSIIKFDTIFSNQLENKINVITSQLKNKISNNCIINRTFEMEINDLVDYSYYKIRLNFSILKGNKCEARLYINDLYGRSLSEILGNWPLQNLQLKFKSKYEEDYYLIKFLNENKWDYLQNEDKSVLLNYEIYNDSTFKINIKNYPILLKVKDFNDCECDLIRVKYTESRNYTKQKVDNDNNKEVDIVPLSGDNRPVIKY